MVERRIAIVMVDRRIARCFCGFVAEGPWLAEEALEHANETFHGVDIVGEDEFAMFTVVVPTVPLIVRM